MQKMKNGKKVLSVCLSLAMAAGMLSTSAFASWNVYGGSNNHNAVVTGGSYRDGCFRPGQLHPTALYRLRLGWCGQRARNADGEAGLPMLTFSTMAMEPAARW